MSRSAERTWRLVDKKSYEHHVDRIVLIMEGAGRIASDFNFIEGFDLGDKLIGALYSYVRTKNRLPEIRVTEKERMKRLEAIRKTGSLKGANSRDIVDLTLSGLNTAEEPIDKKSRGHLSRAVRTAMQLRVNEIEEKGALKLGGRKPDLPEQNLCRDLALIYFRGTGKLPASARGRSGYRGQYMRFARRCCDLLDINITDSRLNKQMLEVRGRIKTNET